MKFNQPLSHLITHQPSAMKVLSTSKASPIHTTTRSSKTTYSSYILFLILSSLTNITTIYSFTPLSFTKKLTSSYTRSTILYSSTNNNNEDDENNNEDGMSLAADFFKTIQSRNIQLDEYDFLDDEEEDDDDDDDDDDLNQNQNVQQDTSSSSSTNTGTPLSDNQLNNELNERVLETAGGFVDLVRSAKQSNDNEDDDDDDNDTTSDGPKPYEPPKTIPDPALTAGEVVMTVLEALNNNDNPTSDYGIQVLFGYSSQGSAISQAIQVEGMTPAEYATFLKEEYEYKILFNHDSNVMIEKGDYSFDRKKAFFTARLCSVSDESGGEEFINVNFILSTNGQGDDDCWLIDSLLIRPPDMRRRRRR